MRPTSSYFIAAFFASLLLSPAALFAQDYTPVLYYNFEQGNCTVITNLGSLAVAGTLQGAAGDERWVAGPSNGFTPGGALEFDGADRPAGDIINTHLAATELGIYQHDYTMAAWIQLTGAVDQEFVFGQTNAASEVLHNGVRGAKAHQGHWGNDITAASTLATATWHHVIWQYEGGREKIFVNGVIDGGPVARGVLNNTNIVSVGGCGPTGWGFDGLIDDVVIYNQALSRGQILHLAAGGDPLNLPPQGTLNDGIFFTGPFGAGGTWNLYEIIGVDVGSAATFVNAESFATNKVDPSGLTSLVGHLADVQSAAENFYLSRMSGFRTIWIGLTDDDIMFGGTEAGNNKNGGWVWTSGAPFSYQKWNGVEPNNAGAGGEDAIQLVANSGLWNDHLIGFGVQVTNAPALPYIIEWAVEADAPITGVTIPDPVLPMLLPGPLGGDGTYGVQSVSQNGNIPQLISAVDSLVSGGGVISNGVAAEINFIDPEGVPGNQVFVDSDLPYVGNTTNLDQDIVHIYKGRVVIPADGDYTFGVHSDDGCALRIEGQTWTSQNGTGIIDPFDPSTLFTEFGGADFRGVINLAAGEYNIEFVSYQDGGSSGHELYATTGAVAQDVDRIDWVLVGHPSIGEVAIPGVMTVSGTNFLVRTSAPGGNPTITNLNNLADAETELANDTNVVSASWDFIDFVDPQNAGVPPGRFIHTNAFDTNTGGQDDDFALEATATLEIVQDGPYVFGFRGDDGSSLQIVGQTWSNIVVGTGPTMIVGDTLTFDVNTGNSDSLASIYLTTGTYDLRAVYWERGGGANFEIYGDSLHRPFRDLLRANAAAVITDPIGLQLVSQTEVPIIMLTDPAYVGGMFSFTWNSSVGVTYKLQQTTTYDAWTDVATVPSQGAETSVLVPDTFMTPFVVFRVIVE
jgi:hypothetical protein